MAEEFLQGVPLARFLQLLQGPGLDLADALAGDVEDLADFLEGVLVVLLDAEPHPQNLLLPGREGGKRLAGAVGKVHFRGQVNGGLGSLVGQDRAQGVFLVPDRAFQGNRLPVQLENLRHPVIRHPQAFPDFLQGGIAAKLAGKQLYGAVKFNQSVAHVHRDPDGPGFVGDGPDNGLPDRRPERLGKVPGSKHRDLQPPGGKNYHHLLGRVHQHFQGRIRRQTQLRGPARG